MYKDPKNKLYALRRGSNLKMHSLMSSSSPLFDLIALMPFPRFLLEYGLSTQIFSNGVQQIIYKNFILYIITRN